MSHAHTGEAEGDGLSVACHAGTESGMGRGQMELEGETARWRVAGRACLGGVGGERGHEVLQLGEAFLGEEALLELAEVRGALNREDREPGGAVLRLAIEVLEVLRGWRVGLGSGRGQGYSKGCRSRR